MATDQTWTIGEVAERFGLATSVLRHWEAEGLVAPERDASGYRRYRHDDLVRCAVIVRNREAGMTLEAIGALLGGDSYSRHRVLQQHLDSIDERMRALERSRAMTQHAFECDEHDVLACPQFQAFVTDILNGRPRRAAELI